jgi:hypothetical protein
MPPNTITARLAEHRRRIRAMDPDVITSELAELDEDRLGRRRLASEERRYKRLLRELEAATGSTRNEKSP